MLQTGALNNTKLERVVYGRPCAETLAAEAVRRGADRVFLIVSGTLNRETDVIDRVRAALGPRYAGLYDNVPAHTPRDAVVKAAAAARAAGADLLATIGGGSVTDAGKVVQICLQHNVTDVSALDAYRIVVNDDGSRHAPTYEGPAVRQISVPTTLSGGEFNPLGGCTDGARKVKEGYRHELTVPLAVILDPAISVHTPEWLWLSTGVRALDHAVEGLCSIKSNPYSDGMLMHALRLLQSGLPGVKADPADLEARLECQIGMWMAMSGVVAGVPMGASHAIGHILGGTCDVPHGHTSCVMLPNVLRYNASVNGDRQRLVSEAMGRPTEPAADAVGAFIAGLGMPTTLTDVGVGADQFPLIAKNSMHDHWVHTNPRKIENADAVMEILKMAA
ncbi:MAG: iron-containing alcohol dehydrogenase [Minwuiales bacterium]|nr:iron-containing alcohol dehydrogenase [Minwuiales bacterium]